MTDKQPEALEKIAKALLVVAQLCDGTKRWTMSVPARPDSDPDLVLSDALREAAALLRTQHAEIERLNSCIKWEQNRSERIGTHGPGCEKWGSAHYECLLRSVERKDALLKQAQEVLKELRVNSEDYDFGPAYEGAMRRRYEVLIATKQELSQ